MINQKNIKKSLTISERNRELEKLYPKFRTKINVLVNRYGLKLFLSKEDIEDLFSDTMLMLIEKVSRFDPERSNFSTYMQNWNEWLFLRNLRDTKQLYKMEKTIQEQYLIDFLSMEIEQVMEMKTKDIIITLELIGKEDKRKKEETVVLSVNSEEEKFIWEAVQCLPEDKLYVLMCYYVLQHTIENIAESLSVSPTSGWVYRQRAKAINIVKNKLKEKEEN